jgi:hypothetical protein
LKFRIVPRICTTICQTIASREKSLKPKYRALVGFESVAFLEIVQHAKAKVTASAEKVFVGESIPGILTDTWRKFIEAGDEFIKANGHEQYPTRDDRCIYCQQPLEVAAIELINKYREFCNDALKTEVRETESSIIRLIGILQYNEFDEYVKSLQGKLENPQSQSKDLLEWKLQFPIEFSKISGECREMRLIEEEPLVRLSREVLQQCEPLHYLKPLMNCYQE